MTAYFGGIDPGRNGGVAILAKEENAVFPVLFHVMKMPVFESGELHTRVLLDAIKRAGVTPTNSFFGIERAQAMPGQGVSSMFRYGYNFGKIVGLFEVEGFPFDLVKPQTWKGTTLKGTTKDKEAAIKFCERKFSEIWANGRPHDGIADAVCMAFWAMEKTLSNAS